jgi:hypothetical protein
VQPVIRIDSSHPRDTLTAPQVKAYLPGADAIAVAFAADDGNVR